MQFVTQKMVTLHVPVPKIWLAILQQSVKVTLPYSTIVLRNVVKFNALSTVGKTIFIILVFDSEFSCFITSKMECSIEAQKQEPSLQLGKTGRYDFEYTGSSDRGCLAYNEGEYAGRAWWYTAEWHKTNYMTEIVSTSKSRKTNPYVLYKQCLAAGNVNVSCPNNIGTFSRPKCVTNS